MNVLVTGSYGQLGSEIQQAASRFPQLEFHFTDIDSLDITDSEAVAAYMEVYQIKLIINCAAYTAVDRAEDDLTTCYKVNCDAVKVLGEAAQAVGARVIHVSTDYVFDGTASVPYTEDVAVSPTNVYGKSKLAGERALRQVAPDSVIVRTSWLYSSFGNNFVKTMMRLGEERDKLNVIFDQIGTPTYAADLAVALLTIATSSKWVPGIYHFSNEGVCSWYDFTIAIHKAAGISCEVSPIESSEYAVRTPRPHYSVLNKKKIKSTYNVSVPYWVDGLERCVAILKSQD